MLGFLISDGGNVDVVSVEDGVVSLKFQGFKGFSRKLGFLRLLSPTSPSLQPMNPLSASVVNGSGIQGFELHSRLIQNADCSQFIGLKKRHFSLQIKICTACVKLEEYTSSPRKEQILAHKMIPILRR
ncbi:hypothetical protein Rs2_14175 [Raphanus sativus]|nr:hypothetical protein Rs2_14175 [Raphanus sativus]